MFEFLATSPDHLRFKNPPNYEDPTDLASTEPVNDAGDNEYVVVVTASSTDPIDADRTTRTTDQTIVVSVINVNEAPVFTLGDAFSVAEGTATVATLEASDPDSADHENGYTYTIAGGADGGKFKFATDTAHLLFNEAPDYENPTDAASTDPENGAENNEYVVTVAVTSGPGNRALTAQQPIIVTVENVSSLLFSSPNSFDVAENTTTVAMLSAHHDDTTGAPISYQVTGGADRGMFQFASGSPDLQFNNAPNYEDPTDLASTEPENDAGNNEYVVVVTASSPHPSDAAQTLTAPQTIVVTVDDINEAPVFSSGTAFDVYENTSDVATLEASDPDSDESGTRLHLHDSRWSGRWEIRIHSRRCGLAVQVRS